MDSQTHDNGKGPHSNVPIPLHERGDVDCLVKFLIQLHVKKIWVQDQGRHPYLYVFHPTTRTLQFSGRLGDHCPVRAQST